MILGCYSVRDAVTGNYSGIFLAQNDQEALRSFAAWNRDPANAIHSSPTDFTLVKVGEFDRETGDLIPAVKDVELAKGQIGEAEKGTIAETLQLVQRLGEQVMSLTQDLTRVSGALEELKKGGKKR